MLITYFAFIFKYMYFITTEVCMYVFNHHGTDLQELNPML